MFVRIKLSDSKKPDTHVQLLRVGQFADGGVDDDEKLIIDKKLLASLKKNFDNKVRGYEDGKLPLDYFHDADKIAAGWIKTLTLENGDSELWADVDWTDSAIEKLSKGELRYLSVEFAFEYQDNESGKTFGPTLFGAGLTNRPFIKGMKPVVNFSEKSKSKGDSKMSLEELAKHCEEMSKNLDEMKKRMDSYEESHKKAEDEDEHDKDGDNDGDGEDKKKELSEVQKLKLELETERKEKKFEKMLSEGKAVVAQKEAFMKDDIETFAKLAQPLNTKASGHNGGGVDRKEELAEDKIIKLAREKMAKNKRLSFKDAYAEVRRENQALTDQYRDNVKLVRGSA